METAGLPMDIQEKLRDLEVELAEGDITQQGFEKKKAKLLAPYNLPSPATESAGSTSSSLGRSTSPYNPPPYQQHYERDRTAAVVAALETRQDLMPMSQRRNTGSMGAHLQTTSISPSPSFETSSQDSGGGSRTNTPQHPTPPPTMPKTTAVAQRQQKLRQQPTVPEGAQAGGPGVSHKIQQLLNTLKRPKKNRKPIEEYYTEDSEPDVPPPAADPAAPRPVGPMMQPTSGVPLESRQDWHRNLEAAIQHHSTTLGKHPAISTVDSHGKVSVACTYNKLAVKAQKVAYYLLNKLGNGKIVQPGDRVALVFKTDEAASFAIAFWGCIFAAVIPVAIQPPLTKEDPGGQQVGFLLNGLSVTVAITSELTAKQLPKEEGKDHIGHCKGWPKLSWFVAEHLPKTPRDWAPPPRPSPDSIAYIEFTTDKEGSALGVSVSRSNLLTHCRVLTTACQYREGETVVCTEDPKRSIGLWHGVMAAAYCGLHVVFVPPLVMLTLPTVWLHMINKSKASCVLSSSKSISRCIALSQHKELRDLKLNSVRMMLLDDGANPWSLASSDSFFEAYSPKGLTREAMCPCAGSPETLTVSLRRPSPNTPSGRGVMSIAGLSYGVVRVEEAGSITSLTLQDVGLVMPGARIAVVKHTGVPLLCKTDEVGEVVLDSTSCGNSYWGLQGKTNQTFKVQLVDENERVISNPSFVRTGLLGFIGEGGLVFICGTIDGLIQVAGRRHNTEDLISTVMAVEPHGFIYKERVIVFSVNVLKEERVVVVAEQRPNCTDEEAFTWMNSVVPAAESIHGINLYGIVLVGPGRLPKYPNGVVHIQESKSRFIEGTLHPINLLMCPYQCVTNLPVPKQPTAAVTGAAQIIGDLVTGRVMDSTQSASAPSEPEVESTDGAPKSEYLVDILRWRASTRSDDQLYSMVDSRGHIVKSLNAAQLLKRAERIGATLVDKLKLNSGDIVAVIFPPGIDLIVAFYGCLLVGIAPVVIKPPAPTNISGTLPAMKLTVDLSTARIIITSHNMIRFLKSKEASQVIDARSLPQLVDIEDMNKKKIEKQYRPPTAELISYLDFNISTTGVLSGVKISHAALHSMCKTLKSLMELYPSREVALCLDPYSGFGLILWCLSGVYSGNTTYLINPYDLEQNPLLWLSVLSSNRIRDSYCSYSVIDLCCRELGMSIEALKTRNIDLSAVRSCVVVSEERPRVHLLNSFTTLFNLVGLDSKAVSTQFGCRVNPMICLQGPRQPESDSIYVDSKALRLDRITVLEKGSPNSMCLMESGKIIPNGHVTVVNSESRMPCAHTDLGEIWVSSPHNGCGYYGLKESVNDSLTKEHFKANLAGGGEDMDYARTGYLGFISKSDKTDSRGVHYQSLYIVGSQSESLEIRGFRYHPSDLEASIIRCHRNICGSAVFLSNKLLVVVSELYGDESEALDIVPVITTTLLEEHQVVAGIIVVVDPGVIPINSRGEKQRVSLRDSFLADEMDPIYVAYNL